MVRLILKKVDFNNPGKRTLMDRFLEMPLDATFTPSVELFQVLENMAIFHSSTMHSIGEKIDEVINEYNDLINNNDFNSVTVSQKTILISQIESLKQLKMSLLVLYKCYYQVFNDVRVRNFIEFWRVFYTKRIAYLNWLDDKETKDSLGGYRGLFDMIDSWQIKK